MAARKAAPGGVAAPAATAQRPRVVAYFTAWGIYAPNYRVTDIPVERITHLNYAFANISNAGECTLGDANADTQQAFAGDSWDSDVLRGNFHQLQLLKRAHPALRTLISVGGWTWSARFSDVAASASSRARFAASCVRFMKRYGFDGIDIDWEYPVSGGLPGNRSRPADKHNYTLLLHELRRQLDAMNDGVHHLLTIAAPIGAGKIEHLELPAIAAEVDWLNLMAYDLHGDWEPRTNHNAPLHATAGEESGFGVSDAVDAYLRAGVAARQLTLGVPFYGRGWRGVGRDHDGLLQPAAGAAKPESSEPGVFDYKDLAAHYVDKNGFSRHWDERAQCPWLYDAAKQIMISYDDAQSIAAKARYIKSARLGGAMIWELSGDDGTLLPALVDGLR